MRSALNTLAALLGLPRTTGIADGAETDVRYRWVDWAKLEYQHVVAVRSHLADHYAPATANKVLAALRGVLGAAFDLGQLNGNTLARIRRIKPVRGERLPAGRALAFDEVAALLRVCADDPAPAGRRDAALIGLLRGTGIRRSEAVALDLADYEPKTGAMTIRSGKGNKARITYAPSSVQAALDAWLVVRGSEPGPLFYRGHKSGRLIARRLTGQAVATILQARAEQAGVADCSPHDLRRTYISQLLDAGADLATVQQLAGHADPATTARYDRRGEAAKRRAAELVEVPYQSAF
jgi:site-specific recombinase XerD